VGVHHYSLPTSRQYYKQRVEISGSNITYCVYRAVVKANSQSNGNGQILIPRTDFDETWNTNYTPSIIIFILIIIIIIISSSSSNDK